MWPWSAPYPVHSLPSVSAPFSSDSNDNAPTYDYIIVGGGTAGCVLASRLSEDPSISVLLVERGPVINTWASRVPLISLNYMVQTGPKYQWATEPIMSLAGRTFNMISGKAMGGTSKINSFLYTRSVPGEYNAWSQAGRKGWSYDELEPIFSRSEKSLTHGTSSHRGSTGLWENQRLEEIPFENIHQTIKAATALGIPYVEEANDPDRPVTSCTRVDMTIDSNSRRHSTFDAFLPAHIVNQRKGNLKICPETVAASLDIKSEAEGLKAVGVVLVHDSPKSPGDRYYVRARREIVLCSGAIGSPQLLLLSGIGPKDHLQTMGVPVVKHLPGVGSHLQDHYSVSVMYTAPLKDTIHAVQRKPLVGLWEFIKYISLGKGLFLAPNPQMEIFARSELLDEDFKTVVKAPSEVDPRDPANLPDIEVQPIPYKTCDEDIELKPEDGVFSFLCVLLRPKSTGTVRLSSTDPRMRPACDLGYLTAAEDYPTLRKAIRLALRLGEQIRAQKYPLEDLSVPQSEGEEDMDDFIRAAGRTSYHYSSTCRMAPEDDAAPGVVDDELRVHGVQGLRIADASVFPSIPATHLQAPAVMLAEKCADFLKSSRKSN